MVGVPSNPPSSSFLEALLRCNGIAAGDFAAWELLPGMRFSERSAWWKEGSERDFPHEGIDLRGFRTRDGRLVPLRAGTRVPVVWAGTVVSIVPDFLGRSIFVAHDRRDGDRVRLHSVYGHLDPRAGLAPGSALCAGEEVGVITDPSARKSPVPAHLHLTVAWIAANAGGTLDWSLLRDQALTVLIDPLPLLRG